ncbi:MAG TPA: hypothetical protein VK850_12730, partial [Candidatus Binatia bacterium]|nr:hypothetical protein [Candidatus Binatia bacterium]
HYATDKSGIIIRLSRNEYPAVEALLLHALGRPQVGPVNTHEGTIASGYRLTPNGATLQFGRDRNWTLVIVLRERTAEDAAAEFLRRLH